jgi:DNA-binding response OmpR family regulator
MTARLATAEQRVVSEMILVVESDPERGRGIVEQLAADGYRAELARTPEHARVLARGCEPRLAVLGGLDSPRGALDLLEEMRHPDRSGAPWPKEIPVIMVGGEARELDVLRGFEAGADDVLTRPARYLELRARLRAILRRTGNVQHGERALQVGPLTIESSARSVSLHGQLLDFRPVEFQLLLHLASEPVRVFGKEELLRAVWGYRSSGSTRTVDSHASRVRRKLEAHCSRRWVINVWGVGYRLI